MLAFVAPFPQHHAVPLQIPPLSRRIVVSGLLASGALGVVDAHGRPKPAPIPALPISFAVALSGGKRVVSDAWLKRQLGRAQVLMQPHGVRLQFAGTREIPDKFSTLETAKDRDALGEWLRKGVINAFIVQRLRDIDDARVWRMGVRWRQRSNVSRDYVIVTASALRSTLCHELGHFLGNGHSRVVNNVMSYRRDDPAAVHFDATQGRRMRQVARKLLARGKLVAPPPVAEEGAKGKRTDPQT